MFSSYKLVMLHAAYMFVYGKSKVQECLVNMYDRIV